MSIYAKEIHTVLTELNEKNVASVHLACDFGNIPVLDGYTRDLLFVNLTCGRSIVYRYSQIRKQFDLWQGVSFLKMAKE